jgi:hypothetical protein
VDRIVLKGYFECEQHSEGVCAWQLQNGLGFIYAKRIGNGAAVLVNTSIDDSLGSLTKSNASLAFCRYLLGQNTQIGEHSFRCDERVMLPASEEEIQLGEREEFWVELCDGRRCRAAMSQFSLLVSDPGGVGWVRTLAKPVRHAGVNVAVGETDMTRPALGQVANLADKIFLGKQRAGSDAATAALMDKDYRSLWKIFAWVIIALLLVEPAIANRLKR